MPIDRIPGVGPTNADIATAVAAPSAATIAAAVAAPSAATIAAAVAAPSAATIAAAVAAPSAATIASTVAASVPTLSQINSSVASNASPYGGTWADLGYSSIAVGGTTISGLSGYKYLQIIYYTAIDPNGGILGIRFNSDSSAVYESWKFSSSGGIGGQFGGDTYMRLSASGTSFAMGGYIEIKGSNTTSSGKVATLYSGANTGSGGIIQGGCYWRNTAAINTVTIFSTGGNTLQGGKIAIRGAN